MSAIAFRQHRNSAGVSFQIQSAEPVTVPAPLVTLVAFSKQSNATGAEFRARSLVSSDIPDTPPDPVEPPVTTQPTVTTVAFTAQGNTTGAVFTVRKGLAPVVVEPPEVIDNIAPVLPGDLTFSSVGQTSFTFSHQAATDAVGVTRYEYSLDGTTFTSNALALSKEITGRTPGQQYTVTVRAYDAAENVSNLLVKSVNTLVVPDTTGPVLDGEITFSNFSPTGFDFAYPAATDNVGISRYEYSLDNGVTYTANALELAESITGRAADTLYQVKVRAIDLANNPSNVLSGQARTSQAPDIVKPVMQGQINVTEVTTTGFKVTFQAATDNKGILRYEKSVGDALDYVSIGTSLSFVETGKTAATSYTVRVISVDLSDNYSDPLVAIATTLSNVVDPGNPAPVFIGPAIANLATTEGVAITPFNVASRFSDTDNLVFTAAGSTWPAGLSVSIQGIVSGTVADSGFFFGLKVRATDSVNQTADSNAFNLTVAALSVDPENPNSPDNQANAVQNTGQYYRGKSRNSINPFDSKRVAEVKTFTIDFSELLEDEERITEATFSMGLAYGIDPDAATMLVGNTVIRERQVDVTLAAGVAEVVYYPLVTIETNEGRTYVLPKPRMGTLRVTA